MSFAARISRLPRPHIAEAGARAVAMVPWAAGDVARLIAGAAGSAPYLADLTAHEGEWLQGALDIVPEAVVPSLLADLPEGAAALGPALRVAKRRLALFVALADLGGVWPLETVTGALTAFADRAVDSALRALVAAEIARGRIPGQGEADAATAAGMVALAMGKMGAGELNYSSDIDLILLFDEGRFAPADLAAARAGFVRVARGLTALLSDRTAGGYVFRTDLRLRPDAATTPVCLGMDAAEIYYESVGRTWERAAYIKARPAGGDLAAGARFLARLRPFVWRRHLDFAAIEDAHAMRLRIREHKGLGEGVRGKLLEGRDLKLAPGGIREIEFFAQTRQLIAGGRDPALRVRDTVGALAALAKAGWVSEADAAELARAYRAHREVEHRLQMIADAQTHRLPPDAEGFARLAALMGTDAAGLRAELAARIARVMTLTEGFFVPARGVAAGPALSDGARAIVARWAGYPALRSARAVAIFERIRPDLLARVARTGRPDEALAALDAFLARLPAGVQIFSLFRANPAILDLLVDIAATAPALADYLGQNAGVLDAVLDGAFFARLPDLAGWQEALAAVLAGAGDYEGALDAARNWWKEQHFRIGVHLLRGLVDAEGAGHAYARLAEATLAALWPRVLADVAARHGPPPGQGAAVIGFGSLGAGWLTSGSDLDLIVIYDAEGDAVSTGPRPLAARAYYSRLTQALVTALSAPMAGGRLYAVDMRLRPSGRQGPVATALGAFRDYQEREAWTWEHLALTRARAVAGAPDVAAGVEAFRRMLIARPCAAADRERVLADVAGMRARIARARPGAGPWDLKEGPGGTQDIELVAEAAALLAGAPARETPAQLATAAGWLTPEQIAGLTDAWQRQQRARTALRLVAPEPADPATLGAGAEALMRREGEGAPFVAARAAVAAIIDAVLPAAPAAV